MHIYINNKLAALKTGTSFEYVSENRLFSGSDGYTLTITFPLKDCPENIAIFGHINRADVAAQKVVFDCEIRDKSFYKFGSITITEISETEVKTQFLEGRSEQNFDKTFDKVYINELDLGSPNYTSKSQITPTNAWQPNYGNPQFVALPWVNDYSGNIQNKADVVVDDASQGKYHYEWSSDTTGLSWQPYLLYITKKICEAVGYVTDFAAWENNEEYKYLLICNTLPHAWYMPGFAHALPHWTVEEYFEKLELFLQGEFDFDHRAKRISFAFTQDVLKSKKTVMLQDVIEEHSTEVKVDDDRCEYSEAKNLVYKDCDHDTWKYYSCDWFIKVRRDAALKYKSLSDLIAAQKGWATWSGSHSRGSNIDKLLYAEDCDMYFIIQAVSRQRKSKWINAHTIMFYWEYKCILRPLNQFGGRIVNDEEDADSVEIEFVPVRLDDTEDKYGKCMFLNFSGYDDDNDSGSEDSDSDFMQTLTVQSLKAGEKDKKAEYYDRVYIGFWDGSQNTQKKLPYPWVEDVEIRDDWSNFQYLHFSMRINNKSSNSRRIVYDLETKQKTTFKFLADNIPDVRSLFIIRGKRYVAEKITATFTENGMSSLLKGVFYQVKD